MAREVAPKVLAPRIAASKQTVEFGQLGQGQEEATYVTLENRGRSDLAFNSIHVTCGCTKVSLDKPRVPAGESAKLTITAGNGLGIAQRHRITVYSNDPVRPELPIDVMIAAVSRIGFQPSGIDFGRREKTHLPATEMLALQLDRTAPVKLEGVAASTDLPYVSCEIIGWSEMEQTVTMFVTLGKDAPAGEMSGRLTVRLPGSEREHCRVRAWRLLRAARGAGHRTLAGVRQAAH